jgi:hypothetical protein
LQTTALNGLPSYQAIVPSVIGAFFVLLVVVILLRFDRIFRPDAPPAAAEKNNRVCTTTLSASPARA